MEKDVINRFPAQAGRFDGDAQRFHGFILSDVIRNALRAQGQDFGLPVLSGFLGRQDPFAVGGIGQDIVTHANSSPR